MKKALLFFAGWVCAFTGISQRTEIGLNLGFSNYWGDLSPEVHWGELHAATGVFARLNLSPSFAWNNQFNFLKVSGTDRNFPQNRNRNLSFYSNIYELATLLEFNFMKYGPGAVNKKFTGFVFVGGSAFIFNPQADVLNGTTTISVNLRDYKTEGVSYSKYSFAIPFGLGIKAMLSRTFSMEANMNLRRTFTDYLDDVSDKYIDVQTLNQTGGAITARVADRSTELNGGTPLNKAGFRRGNPDYVDWYMSFNLSLVYRIDKRVKCARYSIF